MQIDKWILSWELLHKPTYNITNNKIFNQISNVFQTNHEVYQNTSRDYKFYNLGQVRYAIDTENGYAEITGVENIFFEDRSFNLASDIRAIFDQVIGLNTDSDEMFRLYNGAFASLIDASGIEYWINKYS